MEEDFMKSFKNGVSNALVVACLLSGACAQAGFMDKVKGVFKPYEKLETDAASAKISSLESDLAARKDEAKTFGDKASYQVARIKGSFAKFAVTSPTLANAAFYGVGAAGTIGIVSAIGYGIYKFIAKFSVKNSSFADLIKKAESLKDSSSDARLSDMLADNKGYQAASELDQKTAQQLCMQFDTARINHHAPLNKDKVNTAAIVDVAFDHLKAMSLFPVVKK
jgi:hypothetical protein